jgi:hypothetical protein
MKSVRAQFWTGITAAACASALLAGCKPAAQGSGKAGGGLYQPQLTPHFQAGEAFKYEATASLDSNMRVIVLNPDAGAGAATANVSGGAPTTATTAQPTANVAKEEHESYAVQLEADGLARSVYPNGTLREVIYLVHLCQIIHQDGKSETLAPAGSVLGARRQEDGRLAFAIDGQAPTPAVAANLGFVAQLGDPNETDDALLGPAGPVAVGESWSVSPEKLLKSGFAQAYPGTEQAVGKFYLESVQPDETGHFSMVVSGGFALEGMRPPFPPQVEALPSVVNYQMTITSPVDAGAGVYQADLKTLTHHQGRAVPGADGSGLPGETRFDINISLEQHARYTFDPAMQPAAALVDAPPVPSLPPPGKEEPAETDGASPPPSATAGNGP